MKSIRQWAMSNDCLVRAHETSTEECRNIESEAHRRSVTEPSWTGGYVFSALVRFVYLLASTIMQKLFHRFTQNSVER